MERGAPPLLSNITTGATTQQSSRGHQAATHATIVVTTHGQEAELLHVADLGQESHKNQGQDAQNYVAAAADGAAQRAKAHLRAAELAEPVGKAQGQAVNLLHYKQAM
ncbi:hypothetical protein EV1_027804 [Malus domestica]